MFSRCPSIFYTTRFDKTGDRRQGGRGEETNIVTQGVNGLNLNPTTLFGLRLNYQIISGEIFHYLVNSLKYSVVFDKIF